MKDRQLAQRFSEFWRRCADSDPAPVWQELRAHYTQPHRSYHSLRHLAQCLSELDAAGAHIKEVDVTEMAIWFHDIIYTYGAKDNEARSAAFFKECAMAHMPANLVDRVYEFIVATQHTGSAQDEAVAFLVDIDLSGFGLPWDSYTADSAALRKEAASVSDSQYYKRKLCFLDELQQRPSLFQTDYFRNRLESVAQANIKRYTAELRQRGLGEDTSCQA